MNAGKSKELCDRYRTLVERTTITAHYAKPGQELTSKYIFSSLLTTIGLPAQIPTPNLLTSARLRITIQIGR